MQINLWQRLFESLVAFGDKRLDSTAQTWPDLLQELDDMVCLPHGEIGCAAADDKLLPRHTRDTCL